ncbi:MAG: hypothetical protein ACE5JG_09175, partial [Planctomycetota bacterium]
PRPPTPSQIPVQSMVTSAVVGAPHGRGPSPLLKLGIALLGLYVLGVVALALLHGRAFAFRPPLGTVALIVIGGLVLVGLLHTVVRRPRR